MNNIKEVFPKSTEMLVSLKGKTRGINKSDWVIYEKKGYIQVEQKDDFEPHMMYDPKTGKEYKADTYEDHLRMKKMGYVHEKPKMKEEVELDEVLRPGTKVKVPHKGKMVKGKIVRFDKGVKGYEGPFYVVDVGEYESPKIPAHKIKEEAELDEAMDKNAKLKIFKKLKKGDEIKIKYDSALAKGKDYRTFVVTRNMSVVGKAKVEKITLAPDGKTGRMKYYLYNRDGNVSFAMGDMISTVGKTSPDPTIICNCVGLL